MTDTFHEHFAINADGSSPFDNYVEHMKGKRAGYQREELDFFETTSAQARDGTLLQRLEAELVRGGRCRLRAKTRRRALLASCYAAGRLRPSG